MDTNKNAIIGYLLLTIGAVGEYGHNKKVSKLLYSNTLKFKEKAVLKTNDINIQNF